MKKVPKGGQIIIDLESKAIFFRSVIFPEEKHMTDDEATKYVLDKGVKLLKRERKLFNLCP